MRPVLRILVIELFILFVLTFILTNPPNVSVLFIIAIKILVFICFIGWCSNVPPDTTFLFPPILYTHILSPTVLSLQALLIPALNPCKISTPTFFGPKFHYLRSFDTFIIAQIHRASSFIKPLTTRILRIKRWMLSFL